MKANKIQQYLCDVINSQQDFWKHSNDITSPTHLTDIDEECFAQLCNLIDDEDREEFQDKLKELYWFIRKFDSKKENVMKTRKTLPEILKEYLENTPKETHDKDWERLKHFNLIGPDASEYVNRIIKMIENESKEKKLK